MRAGRTQFLHQVADGGEEVLAVVEHEQRVAVGDVVRESFDLPGLVGALQVECVRDGGAQQLGGGQVGERHDPATVAEGTRPVLSDPEGDPGLPHPACADQRDDPRGVQALANVGQQCPAAHERREEGERPYGATLVAHVCLPAPKQVANPGGRRVSPTSISGTLDERSTKPPEAAGATLGRSPGSLPGVSRSSAV